MNNELNKKSMYVHIHTYMWNIRLLKSIYIYKILPINTQTLTLPAHDAVFKICNPIKPSCVPLCKNAHYMSLIQKELLRINLER